MKNTNRRLDLSAKFMKMGQALIEEGEKNKDVAIAQMGTLLVFIGGLSLGSDEDINKFSDLCSMFSAKSILDELTSEGGPFNHIVNGKIETETYDEFIKKINDLKKDDENNEIN